MFTIDLDAEFSADDILEMMGMEEHGPVQQAIDQAVVDYAKRYWAWDTGFLANSATGIGTGILTYTADYASELYYGVRDNGRPINYHLDKNPMAGPFPIERMWADHQEDIVRRAQEVVDSQQFE